MCIGSFISDYSELIMYSYGIYFIDVENTFERNNVADCNLTNIIV